jgi:hypothetical protein
MSTKVRSPMHCCTELHLQGFRCNHRGQITWGLSVGKRGAVNSDSFALTAMPIPYGIRNPGLRGRGFEQ